MSGLQPSCALFQAYFGDCFICFRDLRRQPTARTFS